MTKTLYLAGTMRPISGLGLTLKKNYETKGFDPTCLHQNDYYSAPFRGDTPMWCVFLLVSESSVTENNLEFDKKVSHEIIYSPGKLCYYFYSGVFIYMEGGKYLPKIVRVVPQDDHTLVIELDNSHKIIYDIKPGLKTVRFSNLADIKKFKSLEVENRNTLIWDNMCQITIDEILNMIER